MDDWEKIAREERDLRWRVTGRIQELAEELGVDMEIMPALGIEGLLQFPFLPGETLRQRINTDHRPDIHGADWYAEDSWLNDA